MGVVNLLQRVSSLDVSPQFQPYSKVIIHVSDDTTYEVGNDTGRTLEMDNPFGTQQMAQDILESLSGFQYQPYVANGALLDLAAELGDAANIRGSYGGIYTRQRTFGHLAKADISAPQSEEINHEYKYESARERQFKRQIDDVKASLVIANDRIDASVSRTGGSDQSFGWSLTSDAHRWFSNGREVMSVTASGLKVSGEVEATSGKIGGFNISASAIWNNLSELGGSQTSGVYIGTNGIQLGQQFRVDSAGNVAAANMTITGTLNVGGNYITASQLYSGSYSAYSSGSYWSGGASYGYSYGNATTQNTTIYPKFFRAKTATFETANVERITSVQNFGFRGGNVYVYTSGGIKYLCLQGGS